MNFMKNIPMDLLRSFVIVTQVGGFTQAGELLGRSQPAISLQIKRLEELLSQILLIRRGQKIELTQSGQMLFEYARNILALNDEVLGRLDTTTISGKVKLGIPSEFATTLLPKIIARFRQANPNVTLEVNCDLSKNLLTKTARSQHDLILALHDDPKEAGHYLVKTDDLVWVSSHENDFQKDETVPLIVSHEGCIYRKRAINRLDAMARSWQIVYTIPDLTGIKAAIEEGLGITVLAKSTVPDSLRILKSSKKLPALGQVGISLVSSGKEENEAVMKMSEYLRASLA